MNVTLSTPFIGIDVSKATLDVADDTNRETWRAANTTTGIERTVTRVQALQPPLVVVESTGGLERPLLVALVAAQVPVALVNPGRVREFAKALGLLAKTDKLDAWVLARFAQAVQPPPVRLRSADEQQLSALLQRRDQVLAMLTAEKNRLPTMHPPLRSRVENHLEWLAQELQVLNTAIETLIRQHPDMQAKNDLMQSVPGVGPITAAIMLADLPELGHLNRKEIAALVGVAPFSRDSGQFRGKRWVQGGRCSVRKVLYMATIAAIRHNLRIKAFYTQLVERGKAKKVAIVACMRKLLIYLNAMLRDQRPWRAHETA